MYLANLSTNPERYIKDSYKFFHRVLLDEPSNVYAANGLGIVCAEKGEFDVAREIITRVSETVSYPSINNSLCQRNKLFFSSPPFVKSTRTARIVVMSITNVIYLSIFQSAS